VVVMLEQIDYLEHLRGRSSTCGNAARRVAAWNEPLAELLQCRDRMRGIGARAEAMIREILATGSAQEYERLLHNRPEAP
jgi:DNA polymerase/3'-5' exonuclease PolX